MGRPVGLGGISEAKTSVGREVREILQSVDPNIVGILFFHYGG